VRLFRSRKALIRCLWNEALLKPGELAPRVSPTLAGIIPVKAELGREPARRAAQGR